jgi:hypothetical protein
VNFFQFLVLKTLGPDPDSDRYFFQPKMQDPDPYQRNTDPKHWYKYLYLKGSYGMAMTFTSAASLFSWRRFLENNTSVGCSVPDPEADPNPRIRTFD